MRGRQTKNKQKSVNPASPRAVQPSRANVTDARGPKPTSGALRVLCVDDHDVLIEGLQARFEVDGGIKIVGRLPSAAKLESEVARLQPDMVVMDIEMPGPDAFESTDRMRRRHPKVPVIVLSAHIRDAFISASFRSGMSGYFSKSDDLRDIIRGIYEIARSRKGTFLLGPKVRERCRPPDIDHASGQRAANADSAGLLSDAPTTRMNSLTARQVEVLRMIGKGLTRAQIASEISRSTKTVDAHQHRLMLKLGFETRADLMRFAIREGLAQA